MILDMEVNDIYTMYPCPFWSHSRWLIPNKSDENLHYQKIIYSHLLVVSTYNPIYRMYNPIYNQL